MYTIIFCRRSKYRKPNVKGCFKKDFNTLDEIVSFYVNSNDKLIIPFLHKELTNKEKRLFIRKVNALLMQSE